MPKVHIKYTLYIILYVPGEHLVEEDAEGPPIDSLAVAFALDDLRREVLRCAAQCPRTILHLRDKRDSTDSLAM